MAVIGLCTGTTADWQAVSGKLILLERELGVEITDDGYRNIRQGDGKSDFFDLPIIVNNKRYEEILKLIEGYDSDVSLVLKQVTDLVDDAQKAASDAQDYAEKAKDSEDNAKNSADSAKTSEENAKDSEDKAKEYSELAGQAAAQKGFLKFKFDQNGHLLMAKKNVDNLSFRLNNGRLEVGI